MLLNVRNKNKHLHTDTQRARLELAATATAVASRKYGTCTVVGEYPRHSSYVFCDDITRRSVFSAIAIVYFGFIFSFIPRSIQRYYFHVNYHIVLL